MNPERWFREKFDREPNYSELLDGLAKTQAERQQLLRLYLEPNEQEREQGLKQPTTAHRAIAKLTEQGYFKVIITTNFDCLIEQALEDAGVVATVLSSPEQVEGALPLIHTRCCVFKIHGSYLDTRIRNTPEELSIYPCQYNRLLNRIFDEFGLVVCGWSAEWDHALGDAIFRAPSRRFTTFWAIRGTVNETASRLIKHRDAQEVSIADADSFFQRVHEHVKSLEEFSRPHPLSTGVAVASLKRYLSEPKYRIRFVDLIEEVVDQVLEVTTASTFAVLNDQNLGSPVEVAMVQAPKYEAACSTLLAMATIGGFWAEDEHFGVWERALERLALANYQGSRHSLTRLVQLLPGALLLYALALGALKANRLRFLGRILGTYIAMDLHVSISPSDNEGFPLGPFVDGREYADQPLKNRLFNLLQEHSKSLFTDPDSYTYVFDKLEILFSLGFAYRGYRNNQFQFTVGTFLYRQRNREQIFEEIMGSLGSFRDASPYVNSGIFGERVEECQWILGELQKFANATVMGRG
ncbi:MAG: SIR2 family protein [Caldilineaceae bacterium]|nr:SIR2 family protein [Caldilineaceae bacterium]